MTREEAIKELEILKEDYWDDDGYGHETRQYNDTMLSLDMAIKALEQEPCEDWHDVPSDEMTLEQARQAVKDLRKFVMDNHILPKLQSCSDAISRHAVIDALSHMCSEDKNGVTVSRVNVNSMLRALPPVTPQPKMQAESEDT